MPLCDINEVPASSYMTPGSGVQLFSWRKAPNWAFAKSEKELKDTIYVVGDDICLPQQVTAYKKVLEEMDHVHEAINFTSRLKVGVGSIASVTGSNSNNNGYHFCHFVLFA